MAGAPEEQNQFNEKGNADAQGPVSQDEETQLDEKGALRHELDFGNGPSEHTVSDRGPEQKSQSHLDRGTTQESIEGLLHEKAADHAATLSSRPEQKGEEVDDEVRSIMDQFNDSKIETESSQQGQYTQELEQEMAGGGMMAGHSHRAPTTITTGDPTRSDAVQSPGSPSAGRATNLTAELHQKSLPPAPEPEARFNFHLFLEQLKHRTADPVARYLRSFLIEFGKKQWNVHEQVRIISDFLAFISGKMSQCDIWADNTDSEFDNAREGMEKLVMTRLYSHTFSPEIPAPPSLADSRGRKRPTKPPPARRRGQHQEDVERDRVLAEKMQIFSWVEEQHLDIPTVPPDSRRFLSLAQQELSKINNYRAPRDKVICILNACKVIFGLLKSLKGGDTSADSFMPLLIYTVLRARPRDMVSNIQYIFRFRNQEKLGGESGYYLSSLMGAVQFIENLDRTALTISDADFEKHVEASVAAIAERQTPQETPRASLQEPRRSGEASTSRSPARLLGVDGPNPVQDIIKNIQRPLSNLGRMFSDETQDRQSEQHESTANPAANPGPHKDDVQRDSDRSQRRLQPDVDVDSIVETLSSMFPSLDRDVISDIVIAKQARVGAAVDACLNLAS